MSRYSFHLFMVVCIAIAVPLLMRVQSLFPLYIHPEVRTRVQQIVEEIAEERGWILSDLTITSVADASFVLLRQHHIRGDDLRECFDVDLSTASLTPCSDS